MGRGACGGWCRQAVLSWGRGCGKRVRQVLAWGVGKKFAETPGRRQMRKVMAGESQREGQGGGGVGNSG